MLDNVRLPADAMLPGATRPQGAAGMPCRSALRRSSGERLGAFQTNCGARDYARQRTQFRRPIAGFQLTQAKLVDMAVELHRVSCCRCIWAPQRQEWACAPDQVSKPASNTREALKNLPDRSRAILGAAGYRWDTQSSGT